MGNKVSEMWQAATYKPESRILMVGLDAAGKTTILYKLRIGEIVQTIPTIGLNVETVRHASRTRITSFTVFDMGGRCSMRPLWRYYYRETDAVVWVIDSNDRERLEDAREQLEDKITSEGLLLDCPLLILANKQDLPNSLSVPEVVVGLRLSSLRSRRWHIQGCCAQKGEGLWEGLDWLKGALQAQRDGGDADAAGATEGPQTVKSDRDAGSDSDSTADTEAPDRRAEVAAARAEAVAAFDRQAAPANVDWDGHRQVIA